MRQEIEHIAAQVCIIVREGSGELNINQTTSQNHLVRSSLKRKHADDSDDSIGEGSVVNVGVSESSNEVMSVDVVESQNKSFANDSVRVCGNIGDDFTTSTVSSDADGILIPSPKRLRRLERVRRIGTVAVQTATVATVGAIAAWATLAFS